MAVTPAAAPAPRGSNLDTIVEQARRDRKRLDSGAFGAFSLTTLGVASVIGAGIFVTTGEAAAKYGGPAVLISFVLAGIAAGLTALCYAELAAMIPAAGSTYSYAYAAFGVFMAWFIGWDLLLEYLFAASTVAVGWSGYAVNLMGTAGITFPSDLANPPLGSGPNGVVNLPAVVIVAATTYALVIGARESATANNVMVTLKMTVLILVVVVGAFYIVPDNLKPFVPANTGGFGDYGFTGILRGAGVVFFAYVGFDAVSTAASEARNPQRTIPIGLIGTVLISTVLYVAIALVITGMVPYKSLDVADPIAKALQVAGGLGWLRTLVDIAAVVGLASTVLVTFYGQTRIFMRMSEDGMLPPAFGRINPRFKTPQFATILCGVVGGIVAGILPISILGELVSIGTLLSFLIVAAGVLYLRRTRPELERPFRVPAAPIVCTLAILAALALMATLPTDTWIRLAVWLAIGIVIFFAYARRNTAERFATIQAEEAAKAEASM